MIGITCKVCKVPKVTRFYDRYKKGFDKTCMECRKPEILNNRDSILVEDSVRLENFLVDFENNLRKFFRDSGYLYYEHGDAKIAIAYKSTVASFRVILPALKIMVKDHEFGRISMFEHKTMRNGVERFRLSIGKNWVADIDYVVRKSGPRYRNK